MSVSAPIVVTPQRALQPVGLCTPWVLVLLLQGQSNNAVRAALLADDLSCPSDEVLDRLRTEQVPKAFKPRKHKALLEKLGVAPFFHKTTEAEQALALLRDPRARELVEAAIITGVPRGDVEKTLTMYKQLPVSVGAIELYERTFFDVGAFTRAQLRVLVFARVRAAVMRMVADPEDEAAARRAIEADARSVAIALPSSPLAWAAVLVAAGHPLGRFDLPRVVGQMEDLAARRVSEALLRGGPDDERRAVSFVSVLEKVSTIKTAVVPPQAALLKHFSALRLRTSTVKLPTVTELCADRVTVDMGPASGPLGDENANHTDDLEDEGPSAR